MAEAVVEVPDVAGEVEVTQQNKRKRGIRQAGLGVATAAAPPGPVASTWMVVHAPLRAVYRQHRNYEEELQRDKNPIQEDLEGAEDDDEEEVAVERMKVPRMRRRTYVTTGRACPKSELTVEEPEESVEVMLAPRPSKGKKAQKAVAKVKQQFSVDDIGGPDRILPLPGSYAKGGTVGFELPYDMWWLYEHNALIGNVGGESDFKMIRSSIGLEAPVDGGAAATVHICTCTPKSGDCGETCMNRLMYTECWANRCPCGAACTNRRFQKRQHLLRSVSRFQTKNKGAGVKAKVPIEKGSFIMEYVGEVMTPQAYADLVKTKYKGRKHFHCMTLDSGLVVDGGSFGGEARFINHSCDPNCEIQKWNVLGFWRIGIFAKRKISPGEELAYDYNFHSYGSDQKCHCGSANCRGVMGAKEKPEVAEVGPEKGKGKQARKKKAKKRVSRKEKDALVISSMFEDLRKGVGPRAAKLAKNRRVLLVRNVRRAQAAIFGDDCVRQTSGMAGTGESAMMEVCEAETASSGRKKNKEEPAAFAADVFATKLRELKGGGRAVKTRNLLSAETDEVLDRTAQLTHLLLGVHEALCKLRDDATGRVLSRPFMKLPSNKKHAAFYAASKKPLALEMVHENLLSGKYRELRAYTSDMSRIFSDNLKYYTRKSENWAAAYSLRGSFQKMIKGIRPEATAIFAPPPDLTEEADVDVFVAEPEAVDAIRCVCNTDFDEGTMVQCTKCGVWQHTWCVRYEAESDVDYFCEKCNPRDMNGEIPLETEDRERQSTDVGVEIAHLRAQRGEIASQLAALEPVLEACSKGVTDLEKSLNTLQAEQERCNVALRIDRARDVTCNSSFWKQRSFNVNRTRDPEALLQWICRRPSRSTECLEVGTEEIVNAQFAWQVVLVETIKTWALVPRSSPMELSHESVSEGKAHPAKGDPMDVSVPTQVTEDQALQVSPSTMEAETTVEEDVSPEDSHTPGRLSRSKVVSSQPEYEEDASEISDPLCNLPDGSTTTFDVVDGYWPIVQDLERLHKQYLLPTLIRIRDVEERLSLIIRAKANVTSTLKTIRQQKRLVEIEVTRLQAELDQTDMLIVNAGRVNYWTLVVNDVQYSKGDGVYFNPEEEVSSYGLRDRRKASMLRIDQLWRDGEGRPFVSGVLFLRPHQTFYREEQKFYKNEAILSKIEQTLPLDTVLGRAWLLSPELYSAGRPARAVEEDVWIVDSLHENDKQKWSKPKASEKSKYKVGSCLFREFKEKLDIVKTHVIKGGKLTPFVDPSAKNKRKGKGQEAKRGKKRREEVRVQVEVVEADAEEEDRSLDAILTQLLDKSVDHVTKSGRKAGVGRGALEAADVSYLLSQGRKKRRQD